MAPTKTDVKERLNELFDQAIDSDLKFEGELTDMNYFNLFTSAASKDQLYKIAGSNVCMFNYDFEGKDSILFIFSLPINSPQESGQKNIAERVMKIVKLIEDTFVSVDFLESNEVKEDKFVYVTAVKKLNGG